MKINRLKSGIIMHERNRKRRIKNKLKEYDGIPIVETYRYLGVQINQKLDCANINE